MKRASLPASMVVVFLLLAAGKAESADPKLPVIGGKPALAVVNGEPLTLEEFDRALAELHEGLPDNSTRPRSNPSELLERLINAKLILQEARNIGLDAMPEVTSAVKSYEEDTLRGMLFGERVRDVRKADKEEVEKLYREAVKEIKVKSVRFDNEENGKRLEEDLRAGGSFEEAAKKRLDAREAEGSLEGQYLKYRSLDPNVATAVSGLKNGEVSPLVKIGTHFTIVKLEDVRYPEDAAARNRAEQDALQGKRAAVLRTYTDGLKKKYAKVNEKLFDSLDFESPEPGFEKLLADERIVAEVKGEKPVTIRDLAESLQRKFFHGAERAVQEKKINKRKAQVLDEILLKRVILKEARRKRLDRREYYKYRVEEYRNGVIFGTFVLKAIDPDVKVTEEEMRAYLNEHSNEYTLPAMIRIDEIAFSKREYAESAVANLRKGADFLWTRANAEGRVDTATGGNPLDFGDTPLVVSGLPGAMQKAVSGASSGDYRIYQDPSGYCYVLYVEEVLPSRPQPFESAKLSIEKTLSLEKRKSALREWEEKLREASEVKIFATGTKLDRIVKPHGR